MTVTDELKMTDIEAREKIVKQADQYGLKKSTGEFAAEHYDRMRKNGWSIWDAYRMVIDSL